MILSSMRLPWTLSVALLFLATGETTAHVMIHDKTGQTKGTRLGHRRGLVHKTYLGCDRYEGKGKGKGKSRKGETCNPTPSPSKAPSKTPSATPTEFPTISHEPSGTPSARPTGAPSSKPSASPSDFPTATPSIPPSLSLAPSRAPSSQPSSAPSSTPTAQPSSKPSALPSVAPSKLPTSTPSAEPSISWSPSQSPSRSAQPSILPSNTPSVSFSPTVAQLRMVVDVNNPDQKSIECIKDVPSDGITVDYFFKYEYHMNIDLSADVETVMNALVPRHLDNMKKYELDCNFDVEQLNYFVSITSSPSMDGGGCPGDSTALQNLEADQKCARIEAGIITSVFFPADQGRRLSIDPVVLEKISKTLDTSVAELQGEMVDSWTVFFASFYGLLETSLYGTETSDQGSGSLPGIAAVVEGNVGMGNNKLGYSSAVIGAAGICFIVVVLVVVTRARRRKEAYVKYMEEVDNLEFETEEEDEERDGRDVFFVEEDETSMNESLPSLGLDEAEHDYRTCISRTCPICRERDQPVFISSNLGAVNSSIQRDFGPQRYGGMVQRKRVEDTQVL